MAAPSQLPLLARWGHRWLEARAVARTAADQPVHLLDEVERKAIDRIHRGAVVRAGLIGAASSGAAAIAEIVVADRQEADPVFFWGVVVGVSVVAAVCEIALLSVDALRTVHALVDAAGAGVDDEERRELTLQALARAALDVPNPIEGRPGLNPLQETKKWQLLLVALLYKAKVSATNIVVKLVVRRAMGRAAVRSLLPLAAIPGTALWNAYVCHRMLEEARLRVFGPSLVDDVVARALPPGPLSAALSSCVLRAVACCVVKSADLHPNLDLLALALIRRTGVNVDAVKDVADANVFARDVAALDDAERDAVAAVLVAAVAIDGRIKKRERALVAQVLPGRAVDLDARAQEVRLGHPLQL